MPYPSKTKDDEYASLGPRSRSGRLVWSKSSAQLSTRSGADDDDDDDDRLAAPKAAAPKSVPREAQRALAHRLADVRRHFPGALCADDLFSRVEYELSSRFAFSGANAIAVCNLCRDEATAVLRDRIEEAWGGAFTISGLGGVLTCGVTGFKAGLSHAPVCGESGRERYVFFSFPHIAIDAAGHVGHISRPGRPDASHACGALLKVMGELQAEEERAIREGAAAAMRGGSGGGSAAASPRGGAVSPAPATPSSSAAAAAAPCSACGAAPIASKKAAEPATLLVCNLDPEYSILKGRIDARLAQNPAERRACQSGGLVAVTKAAERAISADLERLVAAAVDPAKADYAVVTGVEVHNWATDLKDPAGASLEILYPTAAYAVVKGKRYTLDLSSPAPAGFSMAAATAGGGGGGGKAAAASAAKPRGGPVGALADRLAGLFRGRGGGGGKAAPGSGINGTAVQPRAITTGELNDRLAPGGAA
jgi:hypothetical protein